MQRSKRITGKPLEKLFPSSRFFVFRFWPSLLHALIGWGFLVFPAVNLSDLVYSYTGFSILNQTGIFGDFYRLFADIANVAIIVGIIAMAIRPLHPTPGDS